jgi:hypothetical protein
MKIYVGLPLKEFQTSDRHKNSGLGGLAPLFLFPLFFSSSSFSPLVSMKFLAVGGMSPTARSIPAPNLASLVE